MAKKKNYDEASVVRSLSKKASINIIKHAKTIEVLKDNTDVGNGSWGKLDYLRKVHDYFICIVKNFSDKKKPIIVKDEDDEQVNNKTIKREAKLNMAAMAKSAMKRVKTK